MAVIELDRACNELHIGNSIEDIGRCDNITTIYSVTHVTNPYGDGWYEVYRGKTILGYVTDVDYVKERW